MAGDENSTDMSNRFDTRLIAAAIFVVVVLVAGYLFYAQPGVLQTPTDDTEQPTNTGDNVTSPFDDGVYAGANEDTGTTEGAESAPVGADITIQKFGVSPARAEGSVGDAFQWHNTNSFPVYLTFDRTDQEPTIQPDDTLKMRFRGITYYQVYNANTDEKIAQGSLYVE